MQWWGTRKDNSLNVKLYCVHVLKYVPFFEELASKSFSIRIPSTLRVMTIGSQYLGRKILKVLYFVVSGATKQEQCLCNLPWEF